MANLMAKLKSLMPVSSRSFRAFERHVNNSLAQISTRIDERADEVLRSLEDLKGEHSYEQKRDMMLYWHLLQRMPGDSHRDLEEVKVDFFHSLPRPVGVFGLFQDNLAKLLGEFDAFCRSCGVSYFAGSGTLLGAYLYNDLIPWDDDIDIAMPRRDFERLLRIVEKKMSDRYLVLNAERYPNYPLMTTRLVKKGTVFVEEVMKDVDCPFGIFLDLYVLDNVADNPVLYQIQSWTAWFWSKLMILRAIPRPTLQQRGIKAKIIWTVCGMVYKAMKLLHISPQWLRMRCERVCRKYNKYRTRRMAFLPDTSPYWNVVDRTRCYPLRKLEFEGRRMNFPGNIEEMLTKMYGDFMQLPPVEKRKTHTPSRLEFSKEEIL